MIIKLKYLKAFLIAENVQRYGFFL
jgi:hypothetical protein